LIGIVVFYFIGELSSPLDPNDISLLLSLETDLDDVVEPPVPNNV